MRRKAVIGGGVAGAALPAALSELTDCVVRGTRLWASEKRDVRAELESHFREGLIELGEEGLGLEESVEVLRAGFGEADLVARLIRRGKQRGRSMLWKFVIRSTAMTVGAAGLGGGYLVYQSFGTPSPSVDYVEQLNQAVRVIPEEQRAWPVLRDALVRFKPMPPELGEKNAMVKRPGDAEWPEVVKWLEANRPLIEEFRAAAEKPRYGFVYDNKDVAEFMRRLAAARHPGELNDLVAPAADPLNPPVMGLLLPHLSEMRGAGWFLTLNARDEFAAGRHEEAIASLDIAHRLAGQLSEGQTLIEHLVGAAVTRLAGQELRSMLYESEENLSEEDLDEVAESHFMAMPDEAISPAFEGEKLMFNDMVQYLFTDDGQGNGKLIPSQFQRVRGYTGVPPASQPGWREGFGDHAYAVGVASFHADRRETLKKYYEVWEECDRIRSLPLYDPERKYADRPVLRLANDEGSARKYALVCEMMPSLSRADQILRERTMDGAATRTVIALASYRQEHGEYPASLDALAREYPRVLATDVYSGLPLRYELDEEGRPRLYSVGADLKDDGGSTEQVDHAWVSGAKTTADIVFWPPVR